MSGAGRYNLEICQGSTFTNTFILRHKIVISVAAIAGETTLNVSPIPHALTSGDTLTFGTVTVTLSADAILGSRTLSVDAISGAIAKNTSAKGNLVDLTGKQARAAIRKTFADTTPLATFTCAISPDATDGEITILLPSNISAALVANISPDRADDIVDLQAATFPDSDEARLFFPGFSAYYWDLEVYDSGDPPIVTRYVFGRVLVTSEVTR